MTPSLDITITHASPVSSNGPFSSQPGHVRPSQISYPIEKSQYSIATNFVTRLLDRAYTSSLLHKRVKVLINPFGGKGSALRWYNRDIAPILSAARCELDVQTTRYSGHAKEIAENLDVDKYDVVACCSGDGLPHEVFNGLALQKDARSALRRVAVVQLPCGTGNAMCLNLFGTSSTSLAALGLVKGLRMPLDLVSVTQGDQRYLSFLSQSVGIVAESDLGTDHLRWMGDARFTWGFLSRVLGKTTYPCDVAYKCIDEDKSSIKARHTQYIREARTPPQTNASRSDLLDDGSTLSSRPSQETTAGGANAGLPLLKFGTINDPLPSAESGWSPLIPMPTVGNFYCGNMSWMTADSNFFQAALPNDGCSDLVTIDGAVPRITAIRLLLAVGNGTLFDHEKVEYRKVEAYRIIPHGEKGKEGYISIDGERVPFEPFQVEVHKGLGTVLSRGGKTYEAPAIEP